jgi:hypothetical protein
MPVQRVYGTARAVNLSLSSEVWGSRRISTRAGAPTRGGGSECRTRSINSQFCLFYLQICFPTNVVTTYSDSGGDVASLHHKQSSAEKSDRGFAPLHK